MSTDNVWLVTADVEQFYTNVDLDLAKRRLAAIMKGSKLPGLLNIDEAMTLMDFVNKNTYFLYDDITYKQKQD